MLIGIADFRSYKFRLFISPRAVVIAFDLTIFNSFPLRAREECIVLSPNDDGVSIRHEIAKANMTIDFDALINITLKFKVGPSSLTGLLNGNFNM